MTRTLLSWSIPILLLALPVSAQDPPPGGEPPDTGDMAQLEFLDEMPPPPGLAAVESARSRMCVSGLDRLQDLMSRLEPTRRREARLEALYQAVALEDSLRVAPFADTPLEREVRAWFERDEELAQESLVREDEEIQIRRREAREAMFDRLRTVHAGIVEEAQEVIGPGDDLGRVIQACETAVLVRPAVLEACGDSESPLCGAARSEDPSPGFLFVDDPLDLWDIEQLRPWTDPTTVRPTPDGTLSGARTAALGRRGNLTLVVTIEPMIQHRSAISEEAAAQFEANLEALGLEFEHPAFVMAPALRVDIDTPGSLGGETHYLLHFGDMSNPEDDVIWVVPVEDGGPLGAFFPLQEATLARLAQGEELILTAVRIPEEEGEAAEAKFSMGLTSVGQISAVTGLVQYLGGGQLSADLASFFPVELPEGS